MQYWYCYRQYFLAATVLLLVLTTVFTSTVNITANRFDQCEVTDRSKTIIEKYDARLTTTDFRIPVIFIEIVSQMMDISLKNIQALFSITLLLFTLSKPEVDKTNKYVIFVI